MNYNTLSHSAEVDIRLQVGGSCLDVVQLGADFLMLVDTCRNPFPPCEAELIVEIDGDVDRRRVFLPEGVCSDSIRTPIATSQHVAVGEIDRA